VVTGTNRPADDDDWLREFWPDPQSEREMYVRTGSGLVRGLGEGTDDGTTDTPIRTSLSHSRYDDPDFYCPRCGYPDDTHSNDCPTGRALREAS